MKTLNTWVVATAMLALTGAAQAELVSLADGTVKDTNTDLIWLQNWNVNGFTNWGTQKAWAEGLDFAGSTDWVLPEISEYAALFAAYGNLPAVTNFTNVQSTAYWSGTATDPSNAWRFFPVVGVQGVDLKMGSLFAVAVRPGDVAAVPEPQTYALMLMGLGAVLLARRKRTR